MSENKGKVKYGILCPSTNLFYEVPDEATYLALLQELQQKAMEPKIQKNKSETYTNEGELYAQLMDEDVSSILQDPIFQRDAGDVEMVEYDF